MTSVEPRHRAVIIVAVSAAILAGIAALVVGITIIFKNARSSSAPHPSAAPPHSEALPLATESSKLRTPSGADPLVLAGVLEQFPESDVESRKLLTDVLTELATPSTFTDLDERVTSLAKNYSSAFSAIYNAPQDLLELVLILEVQFPAVNAQPWIRARFPQFLDNTVDKYRSFQLLDTNAPRGIRNASTNCPILSLLQCLNTIKGVVAARLTRMDGLLPNVNMLCLARRLMHAPAASASPLDIIPEDLAAVAGLNGAGPTRGFDINALVRAVMSAAPSNAALPWEGVLSMGGIVYRTTSGGRECWGVDTYLDLSGQNHTPDAAGLGEMWAVGPVVFTFVYNGLAGVEQPWSLQMRLWSDPTGPQRTFHLQAMIATLGHNVAYVRRQAQWYLVDDAQVRTVQLSEVPRRRGSDPGRFNDPCLLFYVIDSSS